MRRMTRFPTLIAGALVCSVLACDKKADDGGATTGDSLSVAAPAPTAPAELLAASDQEVAAWNQKDPNV